MITARIKGKTSSTEVQIPTRWEEVSFRKWRAICRSNHKPEEYLSIFLGMDREVIARAEFVGLDKILVALNFMAVHPGGDEHPEKIGKWAVPKLIETETVEQFQMLRQEMAKAALSEDINDQAESLPLYAAIYLQPQMDGKPFDMERARKIAVELEEYPCEEVLEVGTFFMLRALNTLPNLKRSFRIPDIARKKKKPGFVVSMSYLVFMRPWTTLRAMWANRKRKSSGGPSPSSTQK